ncbi:hypothetical protein BGX24_004467 [Mortierella sp. AD032]|nr:hypothetical protein BGX24_004467 [Mortierella sp. AD032]
MLFPFIESLIGGPETIKNMGSRKDCDKEMNQFDPNNAKDLETILTEPLIPLPESDSTRRSISKTIQSRQKAIDSMVRQQRLLDPSIYGSASYSAYPGVPGLGVPGCGPVFRLQHGPFSSSLVSALRNKQFKTKPSKVPAIAIQPQPQSSFSSPGPLDPSTASLSSPSSDLQLLLRAQPQDTVIFQKKFG